MQSLFLLTFLVLGSRGDVLKNPDPEAKLYDEIVINHVYDGKNRHVYSQILAYKEIDVYTPLGDGHEGFDNYWVKAYSQLTCFRQQEVDKDHLIYKNPNGTYSTFIVDKYWYGTNFEDEVRFSKEIVAKRKIVYHSRYNLYYYPGKIIKRYIP